MHVARPWAAPVRFAASNADGGHLFRRLTACRNASAPVPLTTVAASRMRPMDKLARYQQKRDFAQTDEPSGKHKVAAAEHPRFVIQKHAASHLHYDLRLEVDGVFKSWAVSKGPSLDPRDKRLAVEVEDHPLAYGDFEGTIPKGQYGGGTVMLWDRGFWTPEAHADAAQALCQGELKFAVAGKKLKGGWVLVRFGRDRKSNTGDTWLLIKHRDGFARAGGALLDDLDRSVAS